MRKFNSVFALAAGVALSFGLAQMPAVAATADTTATTTAGTHHQDKVWRVGCDAAFAPFTYTDEKGQLIGFDVDLIKAIGEEMGYTIDMKGYPFDGIIPTLITNNIDMIISGFTISPGALFLQKTLKNPDMRQFNTPPETYLELQNGGCEVVVNDRPVNDFFLAQSPENKANVVSKDIDIAQNEYYGIAIAKGNTELLKQVNEGLQRVIDNGKFAEISNKWFGYDITDDLKAHSAEAAAALAGGGSGK